MITLLVTLSAIALCGAVLVLVGVWGMIWTLRRTLKSLQDDLLNLDDRFTREQKRKAGRERVDSQMNLREAAEISASLSHQKPNVFRLPGRAGRE